ncbi:alpha/beta fold hydrolase [Lapillicoccus jejuensis]|uniref:Pimeloyl-ACP methyl ester carboxylesterase n=1 Tax=Lapillicoccus jejuensis TaxID=402171 RepID=A0A542DYV1_9MICO|nr:alpha/beta hydrolase [Lapillicoccus jejuensis]TQJ08229.1 pimeloyl-ACP methyl ester carboxylesterase [Lapillicoccus jejuensis]
MTDPAVPTDLLARDRSGPRGGVPLLLVHAGVADRRMWDPVWPALTAERDVLRIDLRGYGASTARPADDVLRPVDDLLAVLDAEDVARCHVVGASYGAGVAVELALREPDRVASLVLLAPGGSLLTEATDDFRAFAAAERAALAAGDLDAAVEANLRAWVDGPGQPADRVDAGVRDLVARMQRRAFELTADWDDVEEAEADPPVSERLAEVTAPTTLVAGGLDVATVAVAVRSLRAALPSATLHEWPDVAHMPSLERPEQVALLLLSATG